MADLSQSGPGVVPAPAAPVVVGQAPPVVVPVPVSSGLRASHVVGGGVSAVVAVAALAVSNHFNLHLSDEDAILVGGSAVSAGIGLGHIIGQVGVLGLFRRVLRGSKG